jgi:peptidoglycan/LPS O-acetylase OafA/YrhL
MDSIKPYSKAIVSILGALVVAVMQAFPDSTAVQQWGSIVAALVTAIAVYAVPNADPAGTHQAESTQPPMDWEAGA